METGEQIRLLDSLEGLEPFANRFGRENGLPLQSHDISILQINVGKRCNLSCKHCHVQAGPDRPELMSAQTFEKCLGLLERYPISTIDITGGSPEMNPELKGFIRASAPLKRRTLVRSNLVILLQPEYRDYVDLYASSGVELAGSLPDYGGDKTDRQRGSKVFDRIVEAMRMLNGKGYGQPDSGLVLDLVHNPVGAYLPGAQKSLEMEYKRRLRDKHGVLFNQLFSLTNCPIGRYLDYLKRSENLQEYMHALAMAYNPVAANSVMCKTTLSVGWEGTLYDCDFNQMLDMQVNHGAPAHIDRFDYEKLRRRIVCIGNHCYCCTAGSGSSCQGATIDAE